MPTRKIYVNQPYCAKRLTGEIGSRSSFAGMDAQDHNVFLEMREEIRRKGRWG